MSRRKFPLWKNGDSFVDDIAPRLALSCLRFSSSYHRRLRGPHSTRPWLFLRGKAPFLGSRRTSSGNAWGRGPDVKDEARPWKTSWIPVDRRPVKTIGPGPLSGNTREALPPSSTEIPSAATASTRPRRPPSAWGVDGGRSGLRAGGTSGSGAVIRSFDHNTGSQSQEWGMLDRRDSRRTRPWQDASFPKREQGAATKDTDFQPKHASAQPGTFWPSARTRIADLGSKQAGQSNNYPSITGWADFEKRLDFEKPKPPPALGSDNWEWVDKVQPKTLEREETPASSRSSSAIVTGETSGQPKQKAVLRPAASPRSQPSRYQQRRERPIKPASKPKPRWRNKGFDEDNGYDDDETAERMAEDRRRRKEERRQQRDRALTDVEARATPILLPQLISITDLGHALGMKPDTFLEGLAELGFENITQDSIMAGETAALVAQEYGFEPTVDTGDAVDLKAQPPAADPTSLPPRPPIVTIMGHVDHGKTTMLDWLRKSSVAAQEHGGITQHIGAFPVTVSTGKQITFLDTPGHAAFLSMRQRGANVTDIVVLVVAADDSVKPQTLEALKHARQAKVPIIIAVNKIDKDEARVEQVKMDLARHGVELEEYGGDVQVVCVSGKTGQGMDDLEESILTLAEILDVRAEVDGMAEGWILESTVKSIGRVATVLVKRGTLRTGDFIVAGTTWAKIRLLRDAAGADVDEATPGTPVEVLGWRDAPGAGDEVLQAPGEGQARAATDYRFDMKSRNRAASYVAAQEKRRREKAELEAIQQDQPAADGLPAEEEDTKMVNFVVKGDVMGSVEAVCAAVMEIGSNEVRPRILYSAVGRVNESDVDHAATSGSYIINFNNPVSPTILYKAEADGVAILDHSIIYRVGDDVKGRLSALLPPRRTTKVLGEADVLQIFALNVKRRVYKNIAGCRVRNGEVTRSALYRVLRNGEPVFEGKLESLMQGKKTATEIKKGSECGMSFEDWQDFQVGDQIQSYEVLLEPRFL